MCYCRELVSSAVRTIRSYTSCTIDDAPVLNESDAGCYLVVPIVGCNRADEPVLPVPPPQMVEEEQTAAGEATDECVAAPGVDEAAAPAPAVVEPDDDEEEGEDTEEQHLVLSWFSSVEVEVEETYLPASAISRVLLLHARKWGQAMELGPQPPPPSQAGPQPAQQPPSMQQPGAPKAPLVWITNDGAGRSVLVENVDRSRYADPQ